MIEKQINFTFNNNDNSYLIKVKVKSKNEKDLGNDSLIHAVVAQAIGMDGYLSRNDKEISIQFSENNSNTGHFFIGKDSYQTHHFSAPDLTAVASTIPSLRMIKIAEQALPKRKPSFGETLATLRDRWPKKSPLIRFFWHQIIAPLMAFGRWIHPKRVYDTHTFQLKEDPHNRLALEDALEETVELLRPYASSSNPDEMLTCLQKGLTTAKAWRTEPKNRPTLIETIYQDLVQDKPVVLVGGYWKEKTFEPLLWSLSKQEGKWTLTQMNYGDEGTTPRQYTFESWEEKKVKQMLYNLLKCGDEPTSISPLELEDIYATGYAQLLQHLTNGPDEPSFSDLAGVTIAPPMSLISFIENIIVQAGGTPNAEFQSVRNEISENPLSLIHETITTQFPEEPLASKTLFSLHILMNRLSKLLKALPDMSLEQRKRWLERMQTDYASLEKQLTLDNFVDVTKALSGFSADLNKLKEEIERLDEVSLQAQKKRMQKLDHVQPASFHLQITPPSSTSPKPPQTAPTAASTRITKNDFSEIDRLKASIQNIEAGKQPSSEAVATLLTSLETLTSRINDCVANGDCMTAIALYNLVMPHMPEPSGGARFHKYQFVPAPFWSHLATDIPTPEKQRERSNQLESISGALGKLSHYFWEAKIKSGEPHLSLEESVNMLSTEAALAGMIEARKAVLRQIPAESHTPQEVSFMAIASSYGTPESGLTSLLDLNPLLKLSENAILEKKFSRIMRYLKYISSTNERRRAIQDSTNDTINSDVRKFRNELEQCKQLLAAARKCPLDAISEEEAAKLAEHYYTSTKMHPEVAIPTEFSVLARHQLMYKSLLNPEIAIAHKLRSFRGMALQLQAFLAGLRNPDLKKVLEITDKRYKMALATIKDYRRLDIACKYQFKPASSTPEAIKTPPDQSVKTVSRGIEEVHYGIAASGGSSFDVELSTLATELAKLNSNVFDTKPLDTIREIHRIRYEQAAGNPGEDFGKGFGIGKKEFFQDPNIDQEAIKSSEETEASILKETLEADDPNPLFHYKLRCLKATKIRQNNDPFHPTIEEFNPYKNVHNTLHTLLEDPWMIDFSLANSKGEKNYEAQKCIYDALFSRDLFMKDQENESDFLFTPDTITSAIIHDPEYFIRYAPHFKKALDIALKEENCERFCFLLYVTNTIHQQIQHQFNQIIIDESDPWPKELRKTLQKALDSWPHMQTESDVEPKDSYLMKGLHLWKEQHKFIDQVDGAVYLTALFSNHTQAASPEILPALREPEVVATILKMGGLIELTQGEATLPLVAKSSANWIKQQLIPHIETLDAATRNSILSLWMDDAYTTQWQPVEGKPYYWKTGAAGQESVVDLSLLQILQNKGAPAKGISTQLPEEILKHEDYRFLFGEQKFLAKVCPGKNLGEILYSFTDKNNHAYRILLNKNKNSILIEREYSVKKGKRENKTWLQFTRPKLMPAKEKPSKQNLIQKRIKQIAKWLPHKASKDPTKAEQAASHIKESEKLIEGVSTEKLLLQSGVWIDPSHPKECFAFVKESNSQRDSSISQELVLKVSLSRLSDQIKSVKTIPTDSTPSLELVHDGNEELVKALSCLPSDQLLFMRKPGSQAITEIRFLHQTLYLQRKSEKDPWILHGNEELDGAEWVMGEARGSAANHLLHSLDVNCEQIGFTVRKGNKTTFLVWPQNVLNKTPHKDMLLRFDKQVRTDPPLKITITDGRDVISTAGGYLELAYLLAIKHNYEQATHFLQQACTHKLEAGEATYISTIEGYFKELPAHSARSAISKIKALLAIRQITREQLEQQIGTASDQAIEETFALYQEKIKRTPFEKKAEQYQVEKVFTGKELRELSYITGRSLHSLLGSLRRIDYLEADQMGLTATIPTQTEVNAILPVLIRKMQRPVGDPKSLLDHIELSEEFVVGNFFTLIDLIREHSITPDQLQPLFTPLLDMDKYNIATVKKLVDEAVDNGVVNLDEHIPNLHKITLDVARRILLATAAENCREQPIPPAIDSSKPSAKAIKKKIPSTLLSLLYQAWKVNKNPTDPSTLAVKAHLDQLSALLTPTPVKDAVITPSGYREALSGSKNVLVSFFNGEKGVQISRLKEALNAGSLFGPTLTPILQSLVGILDKEKECQEILEKTGGFIPVQKIIDLMRAKFDIDLMEALREEEGKKYLIELEKAADKLIEKGKTVPKVDANALDEQVQLAQEERNSRLPDTFYKLWNTSKADAVIKQQSANLQKVSVQLERSLQNDPKADPSLKSTADTALLKGEKAAHKELTEIISKKTTINKENLPLLREDIQLQKELCQKQLEIEKQILLNLLHKSGIRNELPKEIRLALQHPDEYGSEELLYMLEKAYQTHGALVNKEICSTLTRYLLEKAALAVLSGRVEALLKSLETAAAQETSDDSPTWIQTATLVRDLTEKALNFNRYLNADGIMVNPRLHRKILVLESREGFIATPEQLNLIQKMTLHPDQWYELKVGLGKTSVVFPIVLLLLIEEGKFPTAVVTNELEAQNLDSLDRASRGLLEKPGVRFQFRLGDYQGTLSPTVFQDEYIRLLEMQTTGCSPITTINSIQAMDQKQQLLSSELTEKVTALIGNKQLQESLLKELPEEQRKEILENPLLHLHTIKKFIDDKVKKIADDPTLLQEYKAHIKAIIEIENLQKNCYYLGKMQERLRFLMIDEVDDVLNVTHENNVAVGSAEQANSFIMETMGHVMKTILDPTCTQTAVLRKAIQADEQGALKDVKTVLMPKLVQGLFQNDSYLKFLNLENCDPTLKGKIIAYLTHINEAEEEVLVLELPEGFKELIKKLGALKQILQVSLPTALNQQPGVQVGVNESNGFRIDPQANGRELKGTLFGKQQDTIVSQYLHYGPHLPASDSFVLSGLNQIRTKQPDIYKKWTDAANAKNQSLLDFLKEPTSYSERLEFLNLQVFQEKRIRQFNKQMVFNVHNILPGRIVGGMTGTLNEASLPAKPVNTDPTFVPQKAVAEVLLRAAILQTPTVQEMDGTVIDQMKKSVQSRQCKAIINQGYSIEQGDAKATVALLRQAAPDRIFIYVDSITSTSFIWKPNEQPRPITERELHSLARTKEFKETCCFYFTPADKRGRNFGMIPPGYADVYMSPCCNRDDFIQTLGRMRDLGNTQWENFYISQGMGDRMRAAGAGKELTYSDLIEDVDRQDLEEQTGKNLKTAQQSLKAIVEMGTRHLTSGYQTGQDTPLYWQPSKLPLRLFDLHIMRELHKVANDPETGWLEERRTVNLTADFAPVQQEYTLNTLARLYAVELEKVSRMKAVVQTLQLQALFLGPDFIERIEESFQQIEQMERDLTTTFDSLANAVESDQQYLPKTTASNGSSGPSMQAQMHEVQLGQVQQQQQSQQQTQQQEQQQSKVQGGAKKPKERVELRPYESIPLSFALLKKPETHASRKLAAEFWKKELPPLELNAKNYLCQRLKEILTEKLQENAFSFDMADFQLQDLQQTLNSINPIVREPRDSKEKEEWRIKKAQVDALLNSLDNENSLIRLLDRTVEELTTSGGHANFELSGNFLKIFELLEGRVQGDLSLCRVVINNDEVTLISANDYNHTLHQTSPTAVYTLLPATYGKGFELDFGAVDRDKKAASDPLSDPEKRKELLPKIVHAKWFLGCSQFTDEELTILKPWLQAVRDDPNHKSFLEQFGSHGQQDLMHALLAA